VRQRALLPTIAAFMHPSLFASGRPPARQGWSDLTR
jgi:hypothetical protein